MPRSERRGPRSIGPVGSFSAGGCGFDVALPSRHPLQAPIIALSVASTLVAMTPRLIAFAIVDGAIWANLLCSSSARARHVVIDAVWIL